MVINQSELVKFVEKVGCNMLVITEENICNRKRERKELGKIHLMLPFT